MHQAYMAWVNRCLSENAVKPAVLFRVRQNMILPPVEQVLPPPRFVSVSGGNMCIHDFEQGRTFLTQFKGDVGRQLDLRRLKQWAQPIDECLKVDVFLNSFRYCGTSDIALEFPV